MRIMPVLDKMPSLWSDFAFFWMCLIDDRQVMVKNQAMIETTTSYPSQKHSSLLQMNMEACRMEIKDMTAMLSAWRHFLRDLSVSRESGVSCVKVSLKSAAT